jgi:hypothetical protein
MQCLAGDVGAGLRSEKDHRAGEVFRHLDASERNIFLELEEERAVVGVHRGIDGAWSNRVHTNVLRSHVLRGCSRQRMKCRL